jgi:fimbrial chaperone protein
MKAFLLGLLLLLSPITGTFAAEPPPGQIAISPSMIELAIDNKPVNGSIRMQNLKNEAVNVKVEVYNWTLDEQNNVRLIPGTDQSLDRWLLISPVSFTLDPGGSQVIRYSIRPTVKPETGEHRAMIYLSEQPVDKAPKQSGAVQVLFRYGMAMYGYTGTMRESADLESLTFDKASASIRATVKNTGNIHTRLTGEYTAWKAGTFPGFKAMKELVENPKGNTPPPAGLIASGSLHSTPVLPGHRRTIHEKIEALIGKQGYVVALSGKIGNHPIEKLFP